MDYLDPNKKKQKRLRIMFGYGLLGIAIAIATVVLVYLTSGYYVDRTTGEVIQNGLIYVDSKPESAKIFLNGVEQSGRTDARLVVPAGKHEIRLERDGYRPWVRTIDLEGGSVRRLNYPRLVPSVLDTNTPVELGSLPSTATQSIDKRWVVSAFTDNRLQMQIIDLASAVLTPKELPLPVDLIKTNLGGTWTFVEWADDNKTFLATYTATDGSVEYVLVNRDKPEESVNVRSIYPDVVYDSVSIRNRKKDLLYLHDTATGSLSRADTKGAIEPVLEGVIQYKGFGNEAVLYVTDNTDSEETVSTFLKVGDKTHELRDLKKAPVYLLDISKLGSAYVIGIGSADENRVTVYNDPINALSNNDFSTLPVPTTVLRIDNPQELRISSNSSVITVRSGQSFATHEFEEDRSYRFELDIVPDSDQQFRWLDGRHFTISAQGKQHVVDYDGSNHYQLADGLSSLGSFFDKDLDSLYTFSAPQAAVEATETSPAVPATPAQLLRTFMRTEADR